MKNWLLVLASIIFCFSCKTDMSNSEVVSEIESVVDTNADTFNRRESQNTVLSKSDSFLLAISNFSELQRVNNYQLMISENYGVYVISSNGALPTIEKRYDLNESILSKTIAKTTSIEELPKVICDENIYNKSGSFAQEINPLLNSQIWNYSNLNEKEKQAFIASIETIKYTVIDTDSYTYYFSVIDGDWVLSVIDIRTPCQG